MSEMKYSALLLQVMERARAVGSKKSQLVTAERFLLAAGYLVKESPESAGSELAALKKRLLEAFPDLDGAMDMLLNQVDEARAPPSLGICT